MIKLRPLVRSLLWLLSGDGLAKAATLVTTLIAVRALNPLEFGLYTGFYATAVLAGSIWDLGVSPLLTREVATGRLLPRVASRLASLRIRTSPLWLAVFVVGVSVFTRSHSVAIVTLLAFAGASLSIGSSVLPLAILRANFRFRAASVALSVGRWCTTALSLLALTQTGTSHALETLAGAAFAGELTIFVSALVLVALRNSRPTPRGESATAVDPRTVLTLRRAFPFAANGLLSMAYNRFDVLVLAALASATQVSLYAPATRLQDGLYLFSGAAAALALPLTARLWGDAGGQEEVRKLLRRLVLLGVAVAIPVATTIFLYAEPIIRVTLGGEYSGAVTTVRILIWFLPFAAVAAPILGALAGCGRAADATKVFATAFIGALVMHLSLDWWWGATGAAVASLARDPAAVAVAILYARRAGLIDLSGGRRDRLRTASESS
jgi:O-antigen/teichoic acid export membrane protein